jgi:putative FmdB family regulatory protein
MPIYEYQCSGCGVRFERSQRVHEEPVRTCPECGAPTRRIFHPVGIIFKGSGFYVTDNHKPHTPVSSPPSAAAEQSSGSNGPDADTAKGESGAKTASTARVS